MCKLTNSDHGALNELRVSIDLMAKGYKLFRALNPNSPFDLVAYKEDKLYRIEVRTGVFKKDGTLGYRKKDRDKTDIYAWVMPNTIIYEPLI